MAARMAFASAFLPLPGVQSRCASTDELVHVSVTRLDPPCVQVRAYVDHMTTRIQISNSIPAAFNAFYAASIEVEKVAVEAASTRSSSN